MGKKIFACIIFGFFLTIVLCSLSVWGLYYFFSRINPEDTDDTRIQQFASAEEFKKYLETATTTDYSRDFDTGVPSLFPTPGELGGAVSDVTEDSSGGAQPDRSSSTNVQVSGIDEPDIVKTGDGIIYYSGTNKYGYILEDLWDTPGSAEPDEGSGSSSGSSDSSSGSSSSSEGEATDSPEPSTIEIVKPDTGVAPPDMYTNPTSIIRAFPPKDLEEISTITDAGDLLLDEDSQTLIVLESTGIKGYDISTPEKPVEAWDLAYDSGNYLNTARLYNGELYTITYEYQNQYSPCDVRIFSEGSSDSLVMPCTDIYYPIDIYSNDTTYTVSKIDPATGKINDALSFMGSYLNTVVYMSQGAIYLTYGDNIDSYKLMYGFINEYPEIFSSQVVGDIRKLQGYDLSYQSKVVEVYQILDSYTASLSSDDELTFSKNLDNKLVEYMQNNLREFNRTGIVKVAGDSLDIAANGSIPGTLLNQFALDEYEGNLRVATTVSGAGGALRGTSESENDLYILDGRLNEISSIKGLGIDESIYSARFVNDKAYMVTFRQIDPFFVFDLSDPENPKLTGELKIPGFSSYLHPISDELILGVGQEGSGVKLSLFDVSDPTDPSEISRFILNNSWTEVNSNHHAFMTDPDHKIFFIPASDGGFVFGYDGDELELVKSVSGYGVERAVYMDNYLYVIGTDKITVVDENSWVEINELSF